MKKEWVTNYFREQTAGEVNTTGTKPYTFFYYTADLVRDEKEIRILIGSSSGPNFAIRRANLDRS